MRFVRATVSGLVVLALAACTGGSADPPPFASGTRQAQTTIWAAFMSGAVDGFAANRTGTVQPSTVLPRAQLLFPSRPDPLNGAYAVAEAADGTLFVLLTDNTVFGGQNWRVVVFPPQNRTVSSNAYDGAGSPLGIALAPDGVMVAFVPAGGLPVIQTFPYGANDPAPIRTFHMAAGERRFGVGPGGQIDVETATGYAVFAPGSDGSAPLSTVTTTPAPSPFASFAVGSDGSVYIAELVGYLAGGTTSTMYVDVYPPGSGTAARRIGPLPVLNDPDGLAPAIGLDPSDDLYVATNDAFYVFDKTANGNAQPLGTMTYGTLGPVSSVAGGS
jgi:hypothetical protein